MVSMKLTELAENMTDPNPLTGPTWIELERIAPIAEAERLSGLSAATLCRLFPNKIVRLSPRRIGMRVKDALMLVEEPAA